MPAFFQFDIHLDSCVINMPAINAISRGHMDLQYLQVEYGKHSVSIPYYQIVGNQPGHHIFLSAGMHGGEINGIAVIEQFTKWAGEVNLASRLRGKITVFPVLNPSGFAHVKRQVYEDNGDLNRSFGKNPPTTFSQQIAHDLTEKLLKHCDFGIDFHDASGSAALLPHARTHQNEASGVTKEMAQVFGTRLVIERTGQPFMMAIHLKEAYDIPVLTVEIGGAQLLFPSFLEEGVQGIRNFLVAEQMIDGEIIVPSRQFFLTERYGVRWDAPGGMFRQIANLGDEVHAGDLIGVIYDPTRLAYTQVKAPMCGFVFSMQQKSQVPENRILFSILEADQCHVRRTTLDQFEELYTVQVTKIRM
jgi:predicted deacylase